MGISTGHQGPADKLQNIPQLQLSKTLPEGTGGEAAITFNYSNQVPSFLSRCFAVAKEILMVQKKLKTVKEVHSPKSNNQMH